MPEMSDRATPETGDGLMVKPRFSNVTEMPGQEVSAEQLDRLCHRYVWAGTYCDGKDVLEAGCGPGPGLGHLAKCAKRLWAGDYAEEIVVEAHAHYRQRVALCQFDAQHLPFEDRSLDVVILFEALYYLRSPESFLRECRRVLRPGGRILLTSANKDLYDFTPSAYTHRYYGVIDLKTLLGSQGLSVDYFGHVAVNSVSIRQRLFRPAKAAASRLGLVPKTMAGKKLLKRIVFGRLLTLPAEIDEMMIDYVPPTRIPDNCADHRHKIIYCAARMDDAT